MQCYLKGQDITPPHFILLSSICPSFLFMLMRTRNPSCVRKYLLHLFYGEKEKTVQGGGLEEICTSKAALNDQQNISLVWEKDNESLRKTLLP